jgi:hypothetical protein
MRKSWLPAALIALLVVIAVIWDRGRSDPEVLPERATISQENALHRLIAAHGFSCPDIVSAYYAGQDADGKMITVDCAVAEFRVTEHPNGARVVVPSE